MTTIVLVLLSVAFDWRLVAKLVIATYAVVGGAVGAYCTAHHCW